jgi:apolipoprotein N-acyltransferase
MRLLALAASGSIYAWLAPPANWWFLHPVALIPYLWAVQDLRGRQAWFAGWFCGAVGQASIFVWLIHTMRVFSNLPLALAIPVWLIFAVAFGVYLAPITWLLPRLRKRLGAAWPFGFAALYVAVQSLYPQLFPWYDGVVWYQVSWFFQLAALGGTALVGYVALCTNAVLFQALRRRAQGRPLLLAPLVIVALLWMAGVAYSVPRLRAIDGAMAEAPSVRVALVQMNVPLRPHDPTPEQHAQWMRSIRNRARDYMFASRDAVEAGAQLIVWPEAALWRDLAGDTRVARDIRRGFDRWDVEGLLGGTYREVGSTQDYNSAFYLRPDGAVGTRYDKIILLPFGEFMPGTKLFPKLKGLVAGVGDISPGIERVVWEGEHGRYAYVICYEAIRQRLVRQFVRDDLDILVNGTNDAWFGEGGAAYQNAMLATIRSAELGVPLLRAANSGVSLWADVAGRQHEVTPIYEKAMPVFDLPLIRRETLVARVGNWFPWICVFACVLALRPGSAPRKQAKPK